MEIRDCSSRVTSDIMNELFNFALPVCLSLSPIVIELSIDRAGSPRVVVNILIKMPKNTAIRLDAARSTWTIGISSFNVYVTLYVICRWFGEGSNEALLSMELLWSLNISVVSSYAPLITWIAKSVIHADNHCLFLKLPLPYSVSDFALFGDSSQFASKILVLGNNKS
ncbi:hypothetical protein BDF20DRAFT_839405 [Mycotypha africana]|uniref:uncharacterized protein n=1 Tax=Mycotypha africana TaxID=64632 RepID=UPI0022FFD7FB|nr:uncharacterized protein BDF20DRAFT_839405 [Mycotypha africana]KAI8968282.1 hypothetical protein BDF20DRAFT_839405 [Mycotypha africana]